MSKVILFLMVSLLTYSDDKIKLKGVRVSTDGDVEENWSRTFECINGTLVDGGQVYQKMTEF